METEDDSRSNKRWTILFCITSETFSQKIICAIFTSWEQDYRPSFLTGPQNSFIFSKAEPQFLWWPISYGDSGSWTTSVSFLTMQYFGGKLSAAQLQVSGWMGSVRRSLQGALELVWGNAEEKQEEDKEEEEEDEIGDGGGGRFQRAMSPLRSFARRSRRSLHRFSIRSRQTMQRRASETCSVRANRVTQYLLLSLLKSNQ